MALLRGAYGVTTTLRRANSLPTEPRVARFNVTPVKATALQHPDRLRFERFGVPGNREFFLARADRIISLDQHGVRASIQDVERQS